MGCCNTISNIICWLPNKCCKVCLNFRLVRLFTGCCFVQMKAVLGFVGGFLLGMVYYYYLLTKIPFPGNYGPLLGLGISLLLGLGNAICFQLRCISLLTIPMYCGKPGRGVLKVIALTYVVAGPITNLGLNAKEVVRVFACSNELSYELTKNKQALMAGSLRETTALFTRQMGLVKDTFRSIREVVAPIEHEIEDEMEIADIRKVIDVYDSKMKLAYRSRNIENKYRVKRKSDIQQTYFNTYLKKLEYRCHDQITRVEASCVSKMERSFKNCVNKIPKYAGFLLCWPLKVSYLCDLMNSDKDKCDSRSQVNPGLAEGYLHLKRAKYEMADNFKDIQPQFHIHRENVLQDIQDAKETGDRVLHDFEEKMIIMRTVCAAENVCAALLFLRIVLAAATYHDLYLKNIEYDNIYITGYFKNLDARRRRKCRLTILPLKKMERIKYIDVHSFSWLTRQHNKLFTQVLKVMLEIVTATTFVMLDRLFYEALEVVRQHAVCRSGVNSPIHILVEGNGMLASLIRKMLTSFKSEYCQRPRPLVDNKCVPHPRAMPPIFFVRIYGGYLWILLLLYLNPYTMRLRSCFYKCREKQRILHLYNDLLKKRMKMQKTLRRKAVQAVRAHYLSGETLLSMRMKFPQFLGWLRIFPEARMTCLICGETEPRNGGGPSERWYRCECEQCPFTYCGECWQEVGSQCLACDPRLRDLSDVDELTPNDLPKY